MGCGRVEAGGGGGRVEGCQVEREGTGGGRGGKGTARGSDVEEKMALVL